MIFRSASHLLLGFLLMTTSACNKAKATPAALQDAVSADDGAKVTALLSSGGDVNATDDNSRTLIEIAVWKRKPNAFTALLAAGPDLAHADGDGNTVSHYAAQSDDPSFIDALIAKKIDLNPVNKGRGDTPLMAAALTNHAAQAHSLIKAGANLNVAEPTGDTALILAAQTNNIPVVLELLNAGADPLARDKRGASFQRYMNMTPIAILKPEAARARTQVNQWLTDHKVPIET